MSARYAKVRDIFLVFGYSFVIFSIMTPLGLLPYFVYLQENFITKSMDLPLQPFVCIFLIGLFLVFFGKLINEKYTLFIKIRLSIASILAALFFSIFLLSFFFIAGTSYLFLPIHTPAMQMLRIMFCATLIIWCVFFVYQKRKLFLKNTRFQNQMFKIEDDAIYVQQNVKTNIDYKLDRKSWLSKSLNTFMPYVFMLAPMGYPLQKALTMAGGAEAVLLFLFVLGSPLVIYFMARMSWGFYLYVYHVWKLERLHGKPAYFSAEE